MDVLCKSVPVEPCLHAPVKKADGSDSVDDQPIKTFIQSLMTSLMHVFSVHSLCIK